MPGAATVKSPAGQKLGSCMQDIHTPREGDFDFFDEFDGFDGEKRRRDAPARGESPNNLTNYRWHHPLPTAAEEIELIRLVQATDDVGAANKILHGRHRYVLKIAAEYFGPSREDLINAGMEGLWVAVRRFNTQRNNGFTAYVEPWICKLMLEAVEDFRRRGQGGVTRVDRHLFYHRGEELTPETVAKEVKCRVTDTDLAIANQIADGFWHGHEEYVTTDISLDDDEAEEGARPKFVAMHRSPCFACDPSGGVVI